MAAAAEPSGQGALRIVIDAEPSHLNPILDPDLWGYRISHDLICEPLLRRIPTPLSAARKQQDDGQPDQPGHFEGVLAERFRLDPDHDGVSLWLRPGVHFHDGKPLRAHDVRFTLEKLQSSSHVAPRTQPLAADIYKVEVYSDARLHIQLRRPSSHLLTDLSQIDILPERLFEQGSLAHQPNNRRPVCTGPYRFKEWRRFKDTKGTHETGELVLLRDPAYWGPPAPQDELRFLIVSDAARGLALMHRGAELLGRLPPLYVPEQIEGPALHGRRPVEILANQALMVLWNRRNPALASAKVRRAMSQLFDRARLIKDVRHGLGEPLRLPPPLLPPAASPPAAPLPDRPEHPDRPPPAPDQDAKAPVASDSATDPVGVLLDEAGLVRLVAGGPRTREGRIVHFTVLVPAGSSEAQAVFHRLAEDAAHAGIALEAATVDLATLQSRMHKGSFDLALISWSWTGSGPDLWRLLRTGTAQLPTIENPDLDAALDALHRAATPEAVSSAQTRVAALLQELEPVTFLYRPRQLLLVDRRLQPSDLPIDGDYLHLRQLFLSPQP